MVRNEQTSDLVQESVKIQILNQQLEKDNEQVLDKEGLAIVPKTKNLAFLQKHVQVNKDGR